MSRVILVIGASGGIGRAVAHALAAPGHTLVLAARSMDRLRETTEACGEAETLCHSADVADGPSVERLFAAVAGRYGRLDAMVYAAGAGRFGPTLEETGDTWEETMQANLTGMYRCCKAALRLMLSADGGQIVNVLSVAAKTAFSESASYCASKWGALGLTLALAAEYRSRGVRFTALVPGSTDTPFWDRQSWSPKRDRMLAPEHVGRVIADILNWPPGLHADEVVIMPPEGIL